MASHDEVAHNWAHQTGRKRRGFNMFYEGDTIYSYGYHFPIARIDGDAGCILFTTDSRSVSTAKHKTIVRRAVLHLTIFSVPNVSATAGSWLAKANGEDYVKRIKALCTKAMKAYHLFEEYVRGAEELRREADAYRALFTPDVPAYSGDLADYGLDWNKIHMKRETSAERVAGLIKWEEERRRKQKPEMHKRLSSWLKGEEVQPPRTDKPWVRVRSDNLETTWGVKVPLEVALSAFKLAKKARSFANDEPGFRPDDFWPVSLGVNVSPYGAAYLLNKRGTMQVGCHVIDYWKAKIAADLGGIKV